MGGGGGPFLALAILASVTPLVGCRPSAPAPGKGAVEASAAPSAALGVPVAPGLFRDIAVAAGVNFKEDNGARGGFLMVESTPGGCAFLDYDNDGLLDVFLVQSGPTPGAKDKETRPPCRLYHNQGDGKFRDVTEEAGLNLDLGYAQGVAVGDYDNDGYDDLFVTSYDGCYLLHNEGGKRFAEATKAGVSEKGKGRWASSAAFGDYDNDGRLDLIVLHYTQWSPATDRPCKDSKGRKAYCSPEVYPFETPSLYHNRGDGTFEDVTEKAGLSKTTGRGLGVLWTDFDQDGLTDVYIANDLQPNQILHNLGGGKFREEGLERGLAYGADGATLSGMGVTAGDYENSGWDSYIVTNFAGQPNSVYRALGKGMFEDATYRSGIGQVTLPFLAFGIEFMDYDRDGWRDLIIGDGHIDPRVEENAVNVTYAQPKLLFRNDAGKRFERVTDGIGDLATPRVTRGLAIGDYDNDGKMDILANNHNDNAELFHNESRDANHWARLRLEGVRSNRDGAGARVKIAAGGKTYFAECRLSSSYASSSDRRLFFGLGTAAIIEAIEIRWPGGRTDKYANLNLPSDASYLVREGARPQLDPRILRANGAAKTP